MKRFSIKHILIAVLLLVSASGYAQHYSKMQPTRPQGANVRRSPSPGNGAVWIEDDWRWSGNRYNWSGGRWMRPPYAGAIWVPGRWAHSRRGWYWVAGYWQRPSHNRPHNRPPGHRPGY